MPLSPHPLYPWTHTYRAHTGEVSDSVHASVHLRAVISTHVTFVDVIAGSSIAIQNIATVATAGEIALSVDTNLKTVISVLSTFIDVIARSSITVQGEAIGTTAGEAVHGVGTNLSTVVHV